MRLSACFAEALGGPDSVAIARDTRRSGGMLGAAVIAGINSVGVDVVDLGVLPTPGLSWFLQQRPEIGGGIMITASHNAWQDNGLKLFAALGGKASNDVQDATVAIYQDGGTWEGEPGAYIDAAAEAERGYLGSLLSSVEPDEHGRLPLAGSTLVVDTASGAAWRVLPELLEAAGATVIDLAPTPDGVNINSGLGAVHPEVMAAAVVARGADAGVAVDGDGDRIMIADEQGQVYDGDSILGFLAARMLAEGTLQGGVVVGTKTTNSGLDQYLRELGLELLRSDVGDRNVSALMVSRGANLGGETSGHVLTPDACPTGDGSRVALDVLRRVADLGRPLSELLGAVHRYPVATAKVRVGARPALDSLAALVSLLDEATAALAPVGGRHLLRYSGTEPVLRIQVEGPDAAVVSGWAERIEACARECIPE
jgi:phosphoglucosamine mutase